MSWAGERAGPLSAPAYSGGVSAPTTDHPTDRVGDQAGDPAGDPVGDLFASSSVTEHVVRGVLGLLLAVGSFALAPAHPWALLGLVAAAVAWRGCPTCWCLGLAQTLSRGRVGCTDGTCR